MGWVYEYALVDESGKHDLAELRSIQDWNLRYALASVKGVAEVAPVGGFVKQYQVDLDPNKLRRLQHPAQRGRQRDQDEQRRCRRQIFEIATNRVLRPRPRLHQKDRGHRKHRPQSRERHADLREKRRHGASRRRHPARRRGAGRQRRNRRRHRRHALRRERAQRHRRRQKEDRGNQSLAARGRARSCRPTTAAI